VNTIQHNKPAKNNRLRSLDALRGFDMFWIVCGEGIFHGIASVIQQKHGLVQNKTDWQIGVNEHLSFIERFFISISNQLHHTVWNGFTFYDLIFPLFIFIAGVSMPFSLGRQLESAGEGKNEARRKMVLSLLNRTVILILLGMVVNGALKFNGYENTRFASVLGRIAISCFFAALLFMYCSPKAQIIWFISILLGYWLLMMLIPAPGYGASVLTPEGNLAGYIDRILLPGKLHRQIYDPEGLLSSLPAIATALLGVFTGNFLQSSSEKITQQKKAAFIMLAGLIATLAGYVWGFFFPINKNMWTSSYVLFAGGWSMVLLAVFYYIIDVAGYKKWSSPLVWMGMNSILIYMAAHGLVNFESASVFLFGGIINLFPDTWHNALLWTGVAFIQFALLYFLYKKKLFLKL
jgi:predicted acyltransferase